MVMKSNVNVNRVLKYIDEHLEESLTIKDIAAAAGYSEYHFIRIFKSCMNTTIMEYINKRRLIKASEEILNGDRIIDAAFKYGWQSHSGFTRAFKKEFDFYPSLLRTMKVSLESLGGYAMNHIFLESTKVGATKEELLDFLQKSMKDNGIKIEEEVLTNVYKCACEAYKGVKRYSGEEYITHLLNVAIVLTQLGVQEQVILAGMFCDVFKNGAKSMQELEKELPKDIYDIVLKVNASQNDLIVAEDEVVLIKLAERLHNMRTIEFIDEGRRRGKAKETIELFMPLARKINNIKLIDELNELSMEYYTGQE